ncbi:putative HD superfamily hydrolase of NAD metabolism [Thermoanaerobacter uzonensis DSM 18761]|uniref:bis(5'-nucleosyl)-tetraphosphatase (symmetrical) n=1 Tax=Thermoanaerobacter uzonensis DSM 18761 TaxID=1123369 RepID=A0A1M4Z6R4_9THEO|nr:bis(5'-nucleosyl)-tetraphosphatase (symmetrical) YqeK [Thermoanaerobacter uzonensis]SHF13638.1 putative HD superfamily hydrolase of NAD metabolism [Thermoanaerobacter uzonensis DSM 18761]
MGYDTERLKRKLRNLLDEKRYLHSIGVMETAMHLAKKYGANVEKAQIAGLLHDCAKSYSDEELLKFAQRYGIEVDEVLKNAPFLLHGPIGAHLVEEIFGIKDQEIKKAIALHTTGDVNMSLLDEIVFLADYIEPNRDFKGVEELRRLAEENLGLALLKSFDSTICYVLERRLLLYEKTVKARNYILLKLGSGDK